ncbi:MAG: hypothetical protein AAGE93_16780 [Bacteroidota bacterium]
MKANLKVIAFVLTIYCGLTANYFALANSADRNPTPITRTSKINTTGDEIITTMVLLDKTTSREDLIHTCRFLADEDVLLTFDSLNIRKAFLGIFGKKRIVQATGKIELPNGISEAFQAGGTISFHSIKITYSQNTKNNSFAINMVEIID